MCAGSRLNVIKGRISACLVYMCQNFVNVKGQVTEDRWEINFVNVKGQVTEDRWGILFTVCNN